jgi:hypothetical protein
VTYSAGFSLVGPSFPTTSATSAGVTSTLLGSAAASIVVVGLSAGVCLAGFGFSTGAG